MGALYSVPAVGPARSMRLVVGFGLNLAGVSQIDHSA